MTEPASIRYKNPGAMWGSALAIKWGAERQAVTLNDGLGQGNNIAVFPTYVQGICAQIDLWRTSRYRDKPFAQAIAMWSGGNNVDSYISFVTRRVPGISRDTVMNDAFWRGPLAIPFLKAQAWHEAGKEYPAPDADWIEARNRVLGLAVQQPDVPPPKPKLPQPTPVAPKAAAAGVLGAALLGAWHFIQSNPIPTICGLAIAAALAIYLLKRK